MLGQCIRSPSLQEDNETGKARGRAPRCIILAPTRELAQQVQREFAEAAPTLSVGVFYGGASLVLFAVPAIHESMAWHGISLTPQAKFRSHGTQQPQAVLSACAHTS